MTVVRLPWEAATRTPEVADRQVLLGKVRPVREHLGHPCRPGPLSALFCLVGPKNEPSSLAFR